ncbi:hypothetical protein [uncultured Gammaproteobacteria bacterium]|nr:hypothetical protein [uncultured Gammaproteobacteria bacterium]
MIQCNYFSISQLENADPNAEMIVRELEMFSTILKQVASDNTKNLTVATRIDYYAIVMRNIAKAISEKNEDGLTELIKQLDSLGVVDLSQRGC